MREGGDAPTHRESGRVSLNTAAGGTNQLWLLAIGDTALVYINGAFITELDIGRGSGRGDVWAGTGLLFRQRDTRS